MENALFSNHNYMGDETQKKYDLEDRTFRFAQNVKVYVDQLPNKTTSFEIGKQLIRSAGSVGANYIGKFRSFRTPIPADSGRAYFPFLIFS
jgi:hypothetical protein